MIWDGSEKAKKWVMDNFEIVTYDIHDDELWVYPWAKSYKVEKGSFISKDEDGEFIITKEKND